jgi:hypothetical protein
MWELNYISYIGVFIKISISLKICITSIYNNNLLCSLRWKLNYISYTFMKNIDIVAHMHIICKGHKFLVLSQHIFNGIQIRSSLQIGDFIPTGSREFGSHS